MRQWNATAAPCLPSRTFEGRRENLNQANKLSRTWATLLDALNKHRGKGQQKVTVEHVHVHSGRAGRGGNHRATGGWGGMKNLRNNPAQSRSTQSLAMHLSPRCGARTRNGTLCRSPAMANGRCRMHGGKSPGAPIGNTNARKHGRYSAEAIAERRRVAALIRVMRGLVEKVDGRK